MSTTPEIGRRHFIAVASAAACAALALPLAAQAQNKLPVVAFLHPQHSTVSDVEAGSSWRQRLRELGWEEGKTLRFENAYAEGREDRLKSLAAMLVEKKVDVIVTAGSSATRAATQASGTIPIVAIGPSLVAMGLAGSMARPGGNVTGPSFDAGPGLSAKRLELLKLAVPAAKRIVFMRNTGLTAGVAAEQTVAAARGLGLELSAIMVDSPADLDVAMAALSRDRPDAIWFADTPANISLRTRIVEFAARERLPAVYGIALFAESGGLMSYGINFAERSRAAALYVDKILRGAKAGELPIDQATTFELVLNLKAARALGLVFPQALLLSADRVIE
ncbi:MAG: ABC transporter substrate-binding protein [Rubrivivax sp.]|nr:ABC transporter substrate-binding protein [Rubrivivax sp.]